MANKYTPEQKQEILTRLFENGGNVKRTAREMSVPLTTVRYFRNKGSNAAATIAAPAIETEADRWLGSSRNALARSMALLPQTETALDAMRVADIALKNYMNLREGRIGATIHIDARQQSVNYTLQLGEREETLLLGDGSDEAT